MPIQFKRDSLKTKIILPLIGMALGLSLIGLFALKNAIQSAFEEATHNQANAIAESLLLTAESHRGLPGLQRFVSSLAADPSINLAVVVGGEPQQVLASSRYEWLGQPLEDLPYHAVREDLELVLRTQQPHFGLHKDTKEYDTTLPGMLFTEGKDHLSPCAVMVHVDYRKLAQAYNTTYILIASLFVGLILLFTAGIYILLDRQVISRLTQLRRGISDSESKANRIDTRDQSRDEIYDLIQAYNQLVTRQDEWREKLRHSVEEQKLLAQVSEKTSNAVIVCNLEGAIEWVNPGFSRITGYNLEEVRGKKPSSFLQGEKTDPATTRAIRAAIQQRQSITADLINYSKDGGHYWIRMMIEPLYNDDGQLEHFIAVESEISEEKQREELLRQAKDEAEALARTKSEFLATMSHEIRTPLNGVIGMTEILIHSELSEDQREYATTANTCGLSLLALINDILDFSKIEAGNFSPEAIPFDLNEVMQQAWRITSDQAEKKGLEYHCVLDPEVNPQLVGDPTRLNQVLLNLASNAIKFTSQGRIELRAQLHAQREGKDWIDLSIRDSGIGISEEAITRIFAPFTQAESSTTRQYGGTGLGLSICKRICEVMGGEIKVESQLGEGSTFTMRIPFEVQCQKMVQAPHSKTPTSTQPEILELAGRRILLTEDNLVNQRVMTIILGNLQCQVDHANNGAEAAQMVLEQQYDFILMDCQMPVMDGYQATRIIREYEADGRCPRNTIIALTANAMDESRQQCLDAGMDDFLTKPLSTATLKKVLLKYLIEPAN